MARVIVVTSGKGGVGKTTVVSNLGVSLANLDYKVLLIDADVELRNLDLVLGLETRIMFTAIDVLNGLCEVTKTFVQDRRQPKLFIFPLCSAKDKGSIVKKEDFENFITTIKEECDYDFILIDSPAGIDDGFITATSPADEAIVVATPEVTSIRDADKVIGILTAREMTQRLIINRIRPGMVQRSDMMSIADVSDILGVSLLGVIPDNESIIIAANRGEPLSICNSDIRELNDIGKAFRIIARRFKGENIDYMTFEEKPAKPKNIVKNLLKKIIKPA
jgi:septum site-determining protein MinD